MPNNDTQSRFMNEVEIWKYIYMFNIKFRSWKIIHCTFLAYIDKLLNNIAL